MSIDPKEVEKLFWGTSPGELMAMIGGKMRQPEKPRREGTLPLRFKLPKSKVKR